MTKQEDPAHKQKIINILKRRLHAREMQVATLGINADPSILIEITEIKANLQEMEQSLQKLQTPTPDNRSVALTSQLPGKTYHELVGRDQTVNDVINALCDPTGKWIVAIDGMGGIGKTALAQEVAIKCLDEHLFDIVFWEQASRTNFMGRFENDSIIPMTFDSILDALGRQLGALDVPQLRGFEKEARVRALLQYRKILLVLDNLEAAKDPQNEIVKRLKFIINPSKFLLTSRHRFQGDVYAVHLRGLSNKSSAQFIRQEANERGIQEVSSIQMAEMKQVTQLAGGSPLAMKLVVGQLSYLPLEIILVRLKEVRVSKSNSNEYVNFYKNLFLPSWELLSADGKKLLIAMTHFVPGIGGAIDAIKATSDLMDDILIDSISELWRLSFLEVGNSIRLKQKYYYLHPLTQYFVLSDIVRVPNGS